MNCPHCGATLPSRPRARMIITGILFCAAAFVLLLIIHIAVVVLAAVLLVVVGVSSFKAALRAGPARCLACRKWPAVR